MEQAEAVLARFVTACICRQLPTTHLDCKPLHQTFAGALSFRVALPLNGGGAGKGVVFVSSDLRKPQASITFWATTSQRSLLGSTISAGRTAVLEGPAIHQFADLQSLNSAEGSSCFLCVPILPSPPLPPAPAAAALLVCYASAADAAKEELRSALLLAGRLSKHHSSELKAFTTRLNSTLQPAEHARWGPGIDPEYPELSCSDSDASSGSNSGEDDIGINRGARSGGAADAATPSGASQSAAAAAAAPWALDAKTLRFTSDHRERRFQQWRSKRLLKADATLLLALLVYHTASCLLPPFDGCHTTPTQLMLLLFMVLLSRRKQDWYLQHRDKLMMGAYVALVGLQASCLPASLEAAPEGMWRGFMLRLEYTWCVLLGIILQVNFVGHCTMVGAALLLKAYTQPPGVADLSGHLLGTRLAAGIAGSWLGSAARAVVLQVVVPCGLAYYMELSSRRTFCRHSNRCST